MNLHLENLCCGYRGKTVLRNVSVTLEAGDFTCLLGPNGSGKSSLLKTIAGILPPLSGRLRLGPRALESLSSAERAGQLAYVPQAHAPLFAFRVLDLVAMGRTARRGLWDSPTKADWAAAEKALSCLGMTEYSETSYTRLSGGERQLVMIARALAQEARILVLDEPAASLDFGNQARVLKALESLSCEGLSILMATHHPDHALRFGSKVWLVQNDEVCDAGHPSLALTEDSLSSLYGTPFTFAETFSPSREVLRVCVPTL